MSPESVVTKHCIKCGHKVPGMRLKDNAECWCGEWLYPFIANNGVVVDFI